MTGHGAASRRSAIVIGGSLGGLFAANLLHRRGWDVRVYERVKEPLAGRGAGIVTHPELLDALRMAGCDVDDSIGVAVQDRVTLNRDGSLAGTLRMPQVLTAWSKLFHLLRSACPDANYAPGAVVTDVRSSDDGAEVVLADGSRHRADMVIAADGFRSAVRQKFLPQVNLEYAGYIAWRGLVDEAELSDATRESIFETFSFCIPPGEQMLGYPVAGADNSTAPGQRRYNFVWYRKTSGADGLADLLTDEHGTRYDYGIAPHLIRPQIVQEMREAAERILAPQFQELVAKVRQPMFQPIYDLQVPELAFGRVALLGDAAFVGRPHCGMGVTKAAGDAVALVDALDKTIDIEHGLRTYSYQRRQFGTTIVAHARHLGAYLQAQTKSETERRMAEKYRTPEAVMRETAVAPV